MSVPRKPLERADVTVCIGTYNRARWLRAAIESVLSQTYDRFLVLVSDNASEDDTRDVMQLFDDPRVVYLPLAENIGRSANEERLMSLLETEYAVFLGDDDALPPTHLESTLGAIRERPTVGVVHTSCILVDGEDRVLDPSCEDNRDQRARGPRVGWRVQEA